MGRLAARMKIIHILTEMMILFFHAKKNSYEGNVCSHHEYIWTYAYTYVFMYANLDHMNTMSFVEFMNNHLNTFRLQIRRKTY